MRGFMLPLITLGLVACTVTDEHFEVDGDVDTLRVNTPEGHVDVVADDDATAIEVDAKRWGRHTQVDHDVRDGELSIDTVCDGAVCAVDYVITIPPDVWVDVFTGDGRVDFEGGQAGGYLTTDSGDVYVDGIEGQRLDVEVGDGSIRGDWLAVDTGVFTTGAGHVALHYRLRPYLADVFTGIGDIELHVPSGTYDIWAFTDWGVIFFDDVAARRGASHVLRAETGAGDILIDGYR